MTETGKGSALDLINDYTQAIGQWIRLAVREGTEPMDEEKKDKEAEALDEAVSSSNSRLSDRVFFFRELTIYQRF